jgi:hypothetical protein
MEESRKNMFKKFLIKVSVPVITISILSLLGCSDIETRKAEDVEKLLQEKYKKEFKVTHIGGGNGTEAKETETTTYGHPFDNESLVIKAVVDKNGELVADNYNPRLISDSLNQVLKKELESAGIEGESNTLVMDADSFSESNTEISLDEFVKTYKPEYFSADMIVKETTNVTAESFEKALQAVYKAGLNTTFQVNIHVISKEDYQACLKKFKELSEISNSMYVDYEVVDEMKLYFDSEGFHIHQGSKVDD